MKLRLPPFFLIRYSVSTNVSFVCFMILHLQLQVNAAIHWQYDQAFVPLSIALIGWLGVKHQLTYPIVPNPISGVLSSYWPPGKCHWSVPGHAVSILAWCSHWLGFRIVVILQKSVLTKFYPQWKRRGQILGWKYHLIKCHLLKYYLVKCHLMKYTL